MKKILDNFSRQAKTYQKFRPGYPQEVFDAVLKHVPEQNYCWDCGTGNGQVAAVLAEYFQAVEATDISQKQIELAQPRPNIRYSTQRAEQTNFPDRHFDLITVAQAAHWFDMKAFCREVRRVGKPGGLLSIWGYGLLRISPEIDAVIDDYYQNKIGPYWNDERRHIDHRYQSLYFDLSELEPPTGLAITVQWTREELRGYFRSWSCVQHYRARNNDDPVEWVMNRINELWPPGVKKEINFPLFFRLGSIG